MMPAQERFLRDNVVPLFEKANNCKVNIATFDNEWDIPRLLKLETGKPKKEIALVKVPFEMTRVLAWQGLMKPLVEVEDSAMVMQDLAEYHALAAGLGFVDDKLYYLPRKLETRILFYRKSMVADAVSKFEKHKARIDAELKSVNGYGLPVGYALEADPNQWDYYDVYVVGSIWANEEYNGVKVGRVAHRAKEYGGTALDLVDRSLSLGAQPEEILNITSDKVVEMYLWEKTLVAKGLYNPSMWQDKWAGADIYNGIKDGKVFMSFLQQIDCFNVHGWSDDPGMPGYLPQAEDMGLAVMPQAVSLGLDKDGKPLIQGTRSISTGGWWWGIPRTSPDAKLAYKFMRFVTSKDIQSQECSKFGMIPVRKDILNNLPAVFDQGWVGEMFKVSVDQVNLNGLTTVPLVKQYNQVAQLYVQAWYKLCVGYDARKDGKMDFATLKMKLASSFSAPLEQIMKGSAEPSEPAQPAAAAPAPAPVESAR